LWYLPSIPLSLLPAFQPHLSAGVFVCAMPA
jgi:hypothetical protein